MRTVGIIAEDVSDVDVVTALMKKLAKKPFKMHSTVGRGGSRILAKCLSWSRLLHQRGCSILLLVRDLDDDDLEILRSRLVKALRDCPIAKRLVVIPVREIEAWLLADQDAINKAMSLKKKVAFVTNPEGIVDPKSRLSDLIRKGSLNKAIYLNTVHNKRIAEACSVSKLRRCTSFQPLETFVNAHGL